MLSVWILLGSNSNFMIIKLLFSRSRCKIFCLFNQNIKKFLYKIPWRNRCQQLGWKIKFIECYVSPLIFDHMAEWSKCLYKSFMLKKSTKISVSKTLIVSLYFFSCPKINFFFERVDIVISRKVDGFDTVEIQLYYPVHWKLIPNNCIREFRLCMYCLNLIIKWKLHCQVKNNYEETPNYRIRMNTRKKWVAYLLCNFFFF